ncbi:MAG TPA: hypothetical protein VNN72_12750 [Polyangiaceae bacterium]|nr:hypothetical protein [Polyangiaceae bacterium]
MSGAGSGGAAGGAAGGAGSGGSAGSTGGATGGMAGDGASGGTGGSATPEVCSFNIKGALSPNIPTVGVVDWSTDLAGLTEARIEFTLDDPKDGELNVGSGGPISVVDPSAWMLGLKPGRTYTYRLVAKAGSTTCISPDHSLTTEVDAEAPVVTRTLTDLGASRGNGFIVACSYRDEGAMIIDADGAVVWWYDVPFDCSRAHMDWAGEYLWVLKANPTPDVTGDVRRVRMDGSGAESISGLEKSHHDFAVLPDGGTAFMLWTSTGDDSSDLVERSPQGALHTVVNLGDSGFGVNTSMYHANSLRYYARDDSYSVTDLTMTGVYQFDRDGKSPWHSQTMLYGIHGHELLPNGNLLYFEAHNGNPNLSGPSPIHEYSYDSSGNPHLEWSYSGTGESFVLGDVVRLSNGNTLINYTTGSRMEEINQDQALVQTLSGIGQIGYISVRSTLYGPPQ